MSFEYRTSTHGKWILAGEHAVIRGHGALVFPVPEKTLNLHYLPSSTALHIQGRLLEDKDTTQILLRKVLEHGLKHVNRSLTSVNGELYIESNIPVGVGMGASAALCVALTRWFISQQWLSENDEFRVARELEHFFHGQSSGMDIIGVSNQTPMYFQKGQSEPLKLSWMPKWKLSFCGEQGPTAKCVQSVQELWAQFPHKGQALDQQMQAAVMNAKQALETPYTLQNQQDLIQAIQQAHNCFEEWGLITPSLQAHIHDLHTQGALAAKPTGSGKGGYVVSFWGTK